VKSKAPCRPTGWIRTHLSDRRPLPLASLALGVSLSVAALAQAQDQPAASPPGAPAAPASPVAPAPADAAAPAAAPVDAANMTLTVTEVTGLVQVREADDQPWRKVEVGLVLGPGAEFRTGPRSMVRFTIPPDQVITLDRLGTVKVLEALREPGMIKTHLGMKYGRTEYQIEASGISHQSKISSPATTLAVRGTVVQLYDQPPFTPEAVSLTGRAEFTNIKRQVVAFGGKGRKTRISGDETSAAENARQATFLDAGPALARSEQEATILLFQSVDPLVVNDVSDLASGLGSIFSAVFPETIDVTTNRTRSVPGNLAFDLNWQGAADLDLIITTPKGERLSRFPLEFGNGTLTFNFATPYVPSGGQIDFDDIGPFDPQQPSNSGRETAYWPETFPKGKYKVGVNHAGGSAASYTIDVVKFGQNQERLEGTAQPGAGRTTYIVKINDDGEIIGGRVKKSRKD
jgi:hypothetical protein